MSNKAPVLISVLIILGFLLSSCGSASTTPKPEMPLPTSTSKPAATMTDKAVTEVPSADPALICNLYQTGALDDRSFGAATWKATTTAADSLGVKAVFFESEPAEFDRSINLLMTEGCDLIIGIGASQYDAIKAAAESNPGQKFGLLDGSYEPLLANVATSVYALDQATFLLGYLAASYTKTGKIGTFAGMIFPGVTIFMDGFYMGMQKYNEVHGKNVELAGWDPVTNTGIEVGNFNDREKGKSITLELIDQGADIILPVAGAAGLGSLDAVKGKNALLVSMDEDWSVMYPDFSSQILASGTRIMEEWFMNIIASVKNGTFTGNSYTGSLQNGGVGILLGADYQNSIDPAVMTEIEQILEEIKAGKVDIHYVR
jgi:basic membrane protein A